MKRLIGLAFLATHACSFAVAPATKPNVLIILSDDLGYGDIGVQGQKEVATPNIDSIAENGVRFTNGYVSGTMCSPTRAGLMTGRYQTRIVFLSITADYRLKSRHGTTPLECIEDATSATRYVRAHAKELRRRFRSNCRLRRVGWRPCRGLRGDRRRDAAGEDLSVSSNLVKTASWRNLLPCHRVYKVSA